MDNENEEKKEIEVVSGDDATLDISPVYDHLNNLTPKPKDENDKREIIIPKGALDEDKE